MWRLILFVFALAFATPFIPGLLQPHIDAQQEKQEARKQAEEDSSSRGRTHEIPIGRNGQYFTEGRMNGRSVKMLVDTGASFLSLPENVARKIGIFPRPSDFKVSISTANGMAKAARVTVKEMRLGGIRLRDVDALIVKEGLLEITLLGMSALGKLERFDFSNDTLILVQ